MSSPPFPDPSYVIAAQQAELQQAYARITYLAAALRQTQDVLTSVQAAVPERDNAPATECALTDENTIALPHLR